MRRTILTALPAAIVVGACQAPGPAPVAGTGEAPGAAPAGADQLGSEALATSTGGATSVGSSASDAPHAASTFDAVWTTVRDTHFDPAHLDPAQGGVDWEGVRTELRPAALAARDEDDLRDVLDDMLERLGQSHFEIVPAQGAAVSSSGGSGDGSPIGRDGRVQAVPAMGPAGQATGGHLAGCCGIDVRVVDGAALVFDLVPMLSASRMGVRRGWEILSIDGESVSAVLTEAGQSAAGSWRGSMLARQVSEMLDGPVGARRVVAFRDERGLVVERTLQLGTPPGEPVAVEGLPELRSRLTARPASDAECAAAGIPPASVGIIAFNVWMLPVVRPFHEAVDRFRTADGLVIDLRGNPGGAGFLATSLAGYLVSEKVSLGDLRTRTDRLRFDVLPRYMTAEGAIAQPYSGPIAVLVDDLTASTSEIFAGGLRAHGRIRIFGQATAGATLPAAVRRLPNGDALLHAVADYTLPDGTRLEGRGLTPDHIVLLRRDDLLAGRDAALDAALRWIGTHRSPTTDERGAARSFHGTTPLELPWRLRLLIPPLRSAGLGSQRLCPTSST